jgi:hypothetical protein
MTDCKQYLEISDKISKLGHTLLSKEYKNRRSPLEIVIFPQ